jgi:hypothetical protein
MGAMDIGYPNLASFLHDCEVCGENGIALLLAGEYIILHDGWIVSKYYL